MVVVGFDDVVVVRLKGFEKDKIKRIVKKNRDLFDSPSHFVRSAVIRQISKFNDKGVLIE